MLSFYGSPFLYTQFVIQISLVYTKLLEEVIAQCRWRACFCSYRRPDCHVCFSLGWNLDSNLGGGAQEAEQQTGKRKHFTCAGQKGKPNKERRNKQPRGAWRRCQSEPTPAKQALLCFAFGQRRWAPEARAKTRTGIVVPLSLWLAGWLANKLVRAKCRKDQAWEYAPIAFERKRELTCNQDHHAQRFSRYVVVFHSHSSASLQSILALQRALEITIPLSVCLQSTISINIWVPSERRENFE